MERYFALLFCFFAFVSGQCCQKTIDYCPKNAVFLASQPRSCTSFGSGHIHTFDGLSYDFHEYGDFYLATDYADPSSWSIQVRQSDCSSGDTLAVPVDQKTSFKGTCNRAFVFVSSSSVEFRHDVNTDYVTVVDGGIQQAPSLQYNSLGLGQVTNVVVAPLAYVTPTTDISRSLGADSDFFVTGFFQGFQFNIWFYASGYSTFQILFPSDLGSTVGGLCGFVDGCVANDLALRSNPPLNSPTTPPASIVETIRTTSDLIVQAGGLTDGSQFINVTANPARWAPAFGSSWRIDNDGSSFDSEDSPNLRWTSSDYSLSGSGDCKFPQGWNTPSFLGAQCAMDLKFKPDTVNGFAFGALPSMHVMMSYCSYYCAFGTFPFHNMNLLPNQCNGYCTYPQGKTDGIPDITTVYGQYPDWFKPDFKFYQTNDPTALFTSTLNLAGAYTFKLTSTDSCESREFNITRTLTCTNKVNLQPATYVPVVRRLNTYGGVYPTVQLFIQAPSGFVRVQATFIKLPDGMENPPPFLTLYPGAEGDKSFSPIFTPDPGFPGVYTIQFSMYDGCSIVYQNYSIIAACSSCAPTAVVENPTLKDFIFGVSFNTPVNGPTAPITQTFQSKNFHASTPAINEPYTASGYTYNWQIVNDDNSLDEIVMTTTTSYEVRRFADSSIAAFAMMYPNGTIINSTFSNLTDAPSHTGPISVVTPTLAALKGPTKSQYGVSPPQREFDIKRLDTTTTTNTTTVVTHFSNVTYSQNATYSVPCTIALTTNPSKQNATVGFTPSPNTGFNFASNCVGQYNLRLNVSEPSCAWAKDDQKLDVDCGPTPDVYVRCLAQLKFNYATKSFPQLTIDASNTTDPYGRTPLQYNMTMQSQPGNNTAVLTGAGATRTATVSDPGTYEVLVSVSNGCNSASTISTFNAYCTGSASEIRTNWVFTTPNQVLYDGSTWGMQNVGISQSSYSENPDVLSNLVYSWNFVNLSANPQPLWVDEPFFSNPTAAAPTVTLTYSNTLITVNMMASQGCGQYANQSGTIFLVCDSQYSADLTIQSGSATIPWTQDAGWLPNVPTLQGLAHTLFSTAPTPGNAVNHQWIGINNSITVLDFTFNPLIWTPTPPAPTYNGATEFITYWTSDGCNYATNNLTLTYLCYGSSPNFTATGVQIGTTPSYTVSLDASASNFSRTNLNPTWRINPPLGTPVPTVTVVNQTFAQFTATFPGDYIITLRYDDGCENLTISATYTQPDCPTLNLTAGAYLGNGTSKIYTVTWASNGFPKFELNGNGSDTGGRNTTLMSYSWIVYSAPNASIYAPQTNITTTMSNPIPSITGPILINGYNYLITNLTWANTTVTKYSWVTLVHSDGSNPNVWPSCFYPDIAGTYVIGLNVNDGCQNQVANLTLIANCAAAPSIGVTASEHPNFNATIDGANYVTQDSSNSWVVTLSRTAPRRVVLDARSTINRTASTSRLTFYWAWNSPDPRAGTIQAQDNIETPYASTSALSISAVGTYSLLLTVHDGCAVSTQAITLTAVCGDAAVPSPLLSSNLNTNGRSYATLRLDATGTCGKNTWEFTNFTTNAKLAASSISNSSSLPSPSISIFLVAFISMLISKFF